MLYRVHLAMNGHIYKTVGTFLISNRKIVERDKIGTPNTQSSVGLKTMNIGTPNTQSSVELKTMNIGTPNTQSSVEFKTINISKE